MNNTFQVQVVRRGVITLPKELRDHNHIEEGDMLTLIELGDGVVVMSPRRSRVDEIADKLANEWKDAGKSLSRCFPPCVKYGQNMTPKSHKVFLDTSVVFAAVFSPTGGARKLFQLGEAGILKLCIGPNVLRECDEVVRRKTPASLPILAQLLELGRVETTPAPDGKLVESARSIVGYEPDAHVLAEAISAQPDWFVTHDKQHFLKERKESDVFFHIGTPGDLIQAIKDDFTLP